MMDYILYTESEEINMNVRSKKERDKYYSRIDELLYNNVNINSDECIDFILKRLRKSNLRYIKIALNHELILNCDNIYRLFNMQNLTFILTDNMQILLLQNGFDIKYHFNIDNDIMSNHSLYLLVRQTVFLNHIISSNTLDCNAIVPLYTSNSKYHLKKKVVLPFFYYFNDELTKKYKDRINFNLKDHKGHTIISNNIRNCKLSIVNNILNEINIDINLQYHNGNTLLHLLCLSNIQLGKIAMLLDKGAILIQNDDGDTPCDILEKKEVLPYHQRVLDMFKYYF